MKDVRGIRRWNDKTCCWVYVSFLSHCYHMHTHTHTHPFNSPFPGLPRWASTRKVKPIWILLKQETLNDSGISWTICKSAPRARQITPPAPHHSVFYRPDALPAAQPTESKHWRDLATIIITITTTTMFMVLSSRPKSMREFTGFIWWMHRTKQQFAQW